MALVEGCDVADSGHDRGCDQRADAWNLSEPLTGWVGRGDLFDLRVHRSDLLFEILPLVPEKADEVAHAWRQVRVSVLEDLGHRQLRLGWCLREGHSPLMHQTPHLV